MGGSTAQRRSNLPAELSSFVGRRHELASVRTGLATHRLVTLRGPGGIGKTRLAYRTAADQERSLADGAWVAELAPVQAPELVPETVVGALGIRSAEGGSPTERLVAHLRDRELLLVLDNCEHVQEAAAALASELLGSCPRVRVLATSRLALALPGELVLNVPPLPMPGRGHAAGSSETEIVSLPTCAATPGWKSVPATPQPERPPASSRDTTARPASGRDFITTSPQDAGFSFGGSMMASITPRAHSSKATPVIG